MGEEARGEYSFVDPTPLPRSYYRLRMIDLDGSYTFIPVIHLERPDTPAAIAVYPNPNSGCFVVHLPLAAGETAMITLHDLTGRQLFSTPVSEQRYAQTTELPVGTYLLSADLASGRVTQRVVVR